MNKQTLIFQGPIATRSGYGDHCRDLLKSLRKMDKFDIKIIPMRWGNTPQDQLDPSTEFGKWILERILTQNIQKPDIFIQVSVANEFTPKGYYNIGITAGVETNIIPKEFIDGSNNMDLILVPSTFTKSVMVNTAYQERDKNTNQILREIKITKPVEVLFEGVDLEVFLNPTNTTDILSNIDINKPTKIGIEGYSFSSTAGDIIDLVTFSTLLRKKLFDKISQDIFVISPSTLKLESCKLTYPPIIKEIGKKKISYKEEWRNNIGIPGGSFTKRDIYYSIIENNKWSDYWYNHCKSVKDDILSISMIPKPYEDINDSFNIFKYLCNSF
jgi:hypothetical protein